jgi:hypothetical protein
MATGSNQINVSLKYEITQHFRNKKMEEEKSVRKTKT